MCDFLYPSVDRCGAILRSVDAIPNGPCRRAGTDLSDGKSPAGGGSCIVALEGLVAGVIDQRVGHVQSCHKVVDVVVL